ncbi:MAG: hypothetical protein LBU72_07025 [Burkholderiaceae bacterium]|nr:hypothetical protein [Burkholderiaceae bacterium]
MLILIGQAWCSALRKARAFAAVLPLLHHCQKRQPHQLLSQFVAEATEWKLAVGISSGHALRETNLLRSQLPLISIASAVSLLGVLLMRKTRYKTLM